MDAYERQCEEQAAREEASARTGSPVKTFISDVICKNGHLGMRYIKTHACVECMREARAKERADKAAQAARADEEAAIAPNMWGP